MAASSSSSFWFEDLGALTVDATAIVPMPDMTLAQKLNAVTRFALYFSAIMVLVKQNLQHAYVFIFVALCTVAIYYNDRARESYDEDLQRRLNVARDPRVHSRVSYRATRDNPFGNVSLRDLEEFPTRPAARNIRDPEAAGQVRRLFAEGVPSDDADVYGSRGSERQFYTMPVTQVPNDQETYAKWLYAPGKTRKDAPRE